MNSILKKSLSFLMVFCMMLFTFAFVTSVNAATEAGTFTMNFYNESKLTNTSGSNLTLTITREKMDVPNGVTASQIITEYTASTPTRARYDMNGGLTFGTSSASGDCTFTVAGEYAVKKVTVVGCYYDKTGDLTLNGETGEGSLNSKQTKLDSCTSTLVWDNLGGITSLKFASTAKRLTIYTITFEYEVATRDFTVTFNSDGGSAVDTQVIKENETVTEPIIDPTKDGYTFIGWFIGDELYDFSQPVTSDFELKAKWEEVAVKNPTMIIGKLENNEIQYNENLELSVETTDFNNDILEVTWESSDENIATVYETEIDGETKYIVEAKDKMGAVQITAIANDGEYSVTSDPITVKVVPSNDEVISVAKAIEIAKTFGTEGTTTEYTIIGIAVNEPTEEGTFYISDGTLQDGEKFRALNSQMAEGVTFAAQEGCKVAVTGTINMWGATSDNPIPQFHKSTYYTYFTVKFETGFDDIIIEDKYLEPGTKIGELDELLLSREGYEFLGWYEEYKIWDLENNAVTSVVTLSAKWHDLSKEQFTITFDLAGGEGDIVENVIVDDGEVITSPKNKPTKEYAVFLGWYTGDKKFDFKDTPITEDIVLTANWYDYYDVIKRFENSEIKASINMEYHKEENTPIVETTESWDLVTDASTLTDGDRIVIVYISDSASKSSTILGAANANSDIRSKTDIVISNGKITDITGGSEITLIKTTDSNGNECWLLQIDGDKYLSATDANKLHTKSAPSKFDDSYMWNISYDEKKFMRIQNVKYTARYIEYNSDSNGLRFCAYKGTQLGVNVYKKVVTTTQVGSAKDELVIDYLQMRFQAKLSKDTYEALLKAGKKVQFGVIAAKVDNLNGQDLLTAFVNGGKVNNILCTPALVNAEGEFAESEEEGLRYQYAFLLKGIPASAYNQEIVAAAYVCIDGEYYFMKQKSYSASDIAKLYVERYSELPVIKEHLEILNFLADAK